MVPRSPRRHRQGARRVKVIRLLENLLYGLIVALALLAGGLTWLLRAVLKLIDAVLGTA